MKLYLHAGKHKTGTTSVQRWLDANRDRLADFGVLYPKLESHKIQHSTFLNDAFPSLREAQERDKASFAEQLDKRTWDRVILSGEVVSILGEKSLNQLAARLQTFDVQPVLVLREWPGFLFSRWQQDIKRRDAWSFSSYIQFLEKISFEHDDCAYDFVCQRLLKSFDRPPRLIGYEAAVENFGSVLPAVLKALAVPDELIPFAKVTKRDNERLSNHHIERIRLANQIHCQNSGLPDVVMFHARPLKKTLTQFFDFGYRVNQSADQQPALWRDIDSIANEAERLFSIEHLRRPYERWHHKFMTRYGHLFVDRLVLKLSDSLDNWQQMTVEPSLAEYPLDLLNAVRAQLSVVR